MGMHDGHRERMRERYMQYGGDAFSKHEFVEMILYYCYPRQDTNEMAHRLLDAFGGSVTRLVFSDPKTIAKLGGISERAAMLFSLIGESNRIMDIEKWDKAIVLDNTAVAGEYAKSYLHGLNVEKLYVVSMDNAYRVRSCTNAVTGTVVSAQLEMRRLVEIAVNNKAANIMLMHNHPSGIAKPSYEDIAMTSKACEALKPIGIELYDHIIVAGENYFSFRKNELINKIKGEMSDE
ncbi:MAG: JAB domain-containing protein [Clostridia bacterium]|nr:JAB domain-containing protein [Clostridia bacterium]